MGARIKKCWRAKLLTGLCLLLLGCALTAPVNAASIVDSGYCGGEGDGTNLTWTLDDEGALTISGAGRMVNSDYVLPWYEKRASIKTVKVNSGVTSIGRVAFIRCSRLTSIAIPNSVTCIGDSAFSDCSSLTSIAIPNGVTSIGDLAFHGCSRLTSIAIPNGVTSIGDEAFYDCSSLTSIAIPNGVTSIGYGAFFSCESLTSIAIPNSVTSIGADAFYDCSSLTSITIPNSVTSIGDWAFYNCSSLTSLAIPNGVTSIGYGAFSSCESLTSIAIPNSVSRIGNGAFAGCGNLRHNLHENAGYLGNTDNQYLYLDLAIDKSMSEFNIHPKTRFIGSEAFSGCKNLVSITIPDSVMSISNYAFYDCSGLTSVAIPNGVTNIGQFAFSDCSSLASIAIPNGLASIEHYVFGSCTSLTSVLIPGSVKNIEESAFNGCSNLRSIAIPNSVTRIERAAFYDCHSLTDVYYGGTEARWTSIVDTDFNESLMNATMHYNVKDLNEYLKVPVNSSDEAQILDAALSQVDMENLLPEITSDMDKLRGPSITIAGETFYLFELESKLNIDFKNKATVQVKADYEKKTVQVLIGYKPIKGTTTIVGDPNSGEDNVEDCDFWKAYTDAKSLYKMSAGDLAHTNSPRFRSKFQDVYDELQAFEMDMIVKAEGKICGYLELSYETGKLKPSEGGAILAVSVKTTQNGRIPSFPAAYVTLHFDVSAEGKIRLVANDDGVVFDPAFDAAIGTAIGVGLGKNTGNFQAYIEGGFDGELGAHVRPMGTLVGTDPFSVDMTGNLYFSWKLKAWLLENGDSYKKELFKLGLYPRLEIMRTAMIPAQMTMEDYLASAKPVTREYLNAISLMSITDDYSFSKVEYPFAEPTLMHLSDGRMLMVWVGDSGGKTDGDRTSIHYSLYSGGAWSDPEIVHESGTYNDHPVLCRDGNMVYMVWMRADTALDGMTAESAMKHMDLVFSSFDGTSWSAPEIVSQPGNELVESDYAITADRGIVSVVWLENSANDLLLTSGENVIHQRSCANGIWDADAELLRTADAVTGLGVDRSEGLQTTYSLTSGDRILTYLRKENGEVNMIDGANCEARWIDGRLYELRDTALYCDGVPTGLDGLTNYEIISSETQTVALTLVPTGFTCELYGSYYDAGSGSWGKWVQLTGFEQYIRSYSAVLDESGEIVAALNLVDVNIGAEEVYDNTSARLVVVDDCRYADLVVSDWLTYDDSLVAPGEVVPVSFEVTNNSRETLAAIGVNIGGQQQEILCSLSAGESAVLTADYRLPSDIRNHRADLTVTPHYETVVEASTANNTASTVFGLADLVATAYAPEVLGNGATVRITVSNQGYADAENVSLAIYRSNLEGELLHTEAIGTIHPGDTAEYVFQLPADLLFLNDPDTMHALSIEAVTGSAERELANNGDRIVFGGLLPLQVCPSVSDNSIKLDVLVKNEQEPPLESTVFAAVYTGDGKLLTVQTRSLRTEASAQSKADFVIDRSRYAGDVCVRVFWVRRNSCEPFTLAWEGRFSAD